MEKQKESVRKAAEPVLTEEQAEKVTGGGILTGSTVSVAEMMGGSFGITSDRGPDMLGHTVGVNASVIITASTFTGNTAGAGGGAVGNWDACVTPKFGK